MPEWPSGFPYFFQFKSEFGNKGVHDLSHSKLLVFFFFFFFADCIDLYFSAARNIINLILVLTIWWCPVYSGFLCSWKNVFAMTSNSSWQNSISFALLHFVLQAKLACYSIYLLTSAFCIPVPYDESDLFFAVSLEGLVVLNRTIHPQLLQH